MGKREGTRCSDEKWKDLEDRRHKLAGRKVSSCWLGYSLLKVGWSGHQTGIMQDQQPPDTCGWNSLPAVGVFSGLLSHGRQQFTALPGLLLSSACNSFPSLSLSSPIQTAETAPFLALGCCQNELRGPKSTLKCRYYAR